MSFKSAALSSEFLLSHQIAEAKAPMKMLEVRKTDVTASSILEEEGWAF